MSAMTTAVPGRSAAWSLSATSSALPMSISAGSVTMTGIDSAAVVPLPTSAFTGMASRGVWTRTFI
jgi:hypothetical protein